MTFWSVEEIEVPKVKKKNIYQDSSASDLTIQVRIHFKTNTRGTLASTLY